MASEHSTGGDTSDETRPGASLTGAPGLKELLKESLREILQESPSLLRPPSDTQNGKNGKMVMCTAAGGRGSLESGQAAKGRHPRRVVAAALCAAGVARRRGYVYGGGDNTGGVHHVCAGA